MKPSESTQFWEHVAGKSTRSFYSDEHTGKWCIFIEDDEAVDEAWERIKLLAQEDKIILAKTSTGETRWRFPSYVICVYTLDWADEASVMATREALRQAGFTEELKYKRDIDTMNGQEVFWYTA